MIYLTNKKIPIQNIYYMLCYAWNRALSKNVTNLNGIKCENLYDLLGLALYDSVSRLIKKGIYKEYIIVNKEISSLKGKINFGESLKNNSFRNGRAYCEFDEFSDNIIYNQIIKATIHNLLKSKTVCKDIKDRLIKIYRHFGHIHLIKINKKYIDKAIVKKNNRHYKLSLDICKLIYNDMIIDEKDGSITFNFEEEKMAYLFEEFVRNFYKINLKDSKVYREQIKWNLEGSEMNYIPTMKTDITIKTGNEVIILDTKYYQKTLAKNLGQDKYHSSHMYQIFSYLKNAEAKGGGYENATGILVYPQVEKEIDNVYKLGNHNLKICTVNLNDEWENIHNRLLEIIKFV